MNPLVQYFRCPEEYAHLAVKGPASPATGYFRFGEEATCYGSYGADKVSELPGALYDAAADAEIQDGTVYLSFDPSQVIRNLQTESYTDEWSGGDPASILAQIYYFVRPVLPVGVRRHLQKFRLRGWDKIPFPRWPVDCSVDNLHRQLMLLALKAGGVEQVPFIWFWPEGASSCAVMTHDVETELGRNFCGTMMAIDDSFGIKASFQVIPEQRYTVSPEFLRSIRERGFEVVVHDLNHDGHLYSDRQRFLERAAKINAYRKEFAAEGFRAGVLYRRQPWYDALDFSYDMSVPNVAHLDPQRGGCCTVMPYFLNHILELPVTVTQDYTLFNILGDYSTHLWYRQMDAIMERNGLMNFIIHPDYVVKSRERALFEELLAQLAHLRKEKRTWIATPGEVNSWWRQRAQMKPVQTSEGWQIEGLGSERARVAYACEKNGTLSFSFEPRAMTADSTARS